MNKKLSFNECLLCGRYCKINRFQTKSFCKTSDKIIISSYLLHFGEEPPVSGVNGSGTIFFSGCSLGCAFCQNYQISSELNGYEISIERLAEIFIELQNKNAHNINLVTPTHFTPSIKKAFDIAKQNKLHIPIVYNSSGYDSIENIEFINDMIDIYLPDFKFIDNSLSKRYCNCDNYPDIAKKNIELMFKKKENLKIKNDIAVSGVLIRHLVMPNAIDNTINILEYLRTNYGNNIFMSVMAQYSPCYNAADFKEINRPLNKKEYDTVVDYLIRNNMDNVFMQELSSNEIYFPDFDKQSPFYI